MERRRSPALGTLAALLALLLTARPADSALGLSLVESPQLGRYLAGASGRQWVLGTDGTISGPDASDYLFGAAAGRFTVTDDLSPAAIVILVDNVSGTGGLQLDAANCSYDGGVASSCDGSGLVETSVPSAQLRLGLEYSSTQPHVGSDSASLSLDLTISYL